MVAGGHDQTSTERPEWCLADAVPELSALNEHLAPFVSPDSQAGGDDHGVKNDHQNSSGDEFAPFDHRPGFFGATRGLVRKPAFRPVVYGHCDPDKNGDGRWRVVLAAEGVQLLELDPDVARIIGRELIAYADLCDEGNSS